MEQGEFGCVNGWWMGMLQDLSSNAELGVIAFFGLITTQLIIWLCSYSTVLPAMECQLNIRCKLQYSNLALVDVVFAWKVFTP